MNRSATAALAALLVAAFLGAGPATALAASPTPSPSPSTHTTLNETLRARASILAAIDKRLSSVRSLKATVSSSKPLAATDRAALGGQLETAATGLATLASKVSAETDPTALSRDAAAVLDDYRVDDLLAPKVRLVIAADTVLQGAASTSRLATRLLAAVTREKGAGRDTQAAEAAIADMQGRIAAAKKSAGGVPMAVLPLTPAGFPGNRPTLLSARASLATAGSDLRAAGEAAHQAADRLRLLTRTDLKASGRKMIGERLKVLAGLTAGTHASTTLTDDDRVALLTLMSTDRSGLTGLAHRIEVDSDLKTLEADIKSIYTDYRIYDLLIPKIDLVMAADALSVATTKLDTSGHRIAELIASAKASGRDTTEAQIALAGVFSHNDAARARVTGVSADLLSLTTADYPGSAATLAADRGSIEDARGELAAAARAARMALAALK